MENFGVGAPALVPRVFSSGTDSDASGSHVPSASRQASPVCGKWGASAPFLCRRLTGCRRRAFYADPDVNSASGCDRTNQVLTCRASAGYSRKSEGQIIDRHIQPGVDRFHRLRSFLKSERSFYLACQLILFSMRLMPAASHQAGESRLSRRHLYTPAISCLNTAIVA